MELINKFSHYEILNHLITGSTFLTLLSLMVGNAIPNDILNLVTYIPVSYTLGFFLGGVGSIFVEPIAKGIVGFYPHSRYSGVAKKNDFIRTLQSSANMARTFTAEFIILTIVSILPFIPIVSYRFEVFIASIIVSALFFLFYLKGLRHVKTAIEEEE